MAAVKFYLHGGRFGFFFGDLSKGEFHYEEIDVPPPPPPPPPSAGQPPGHHLSLASTSLIATAALLSACLLLAVCLIFTYRLRNRTSENSNSSNFWLPEWLRRRQQRSRSSSTRGLEGGILGDQDQDDDFPLHINHVWYVRTAGLDRSLIDSIATFKFIKIQQDKAVDQDDDSGSGGTMINCSVCLSEFQEGEELRLLPKCSHAFHRDCIDMWLSSHINCPLCRTPVIIAAAVDNTSASAPIASPPSPPASSSPSSSSSLPSSSTSADVAITVDEKDLMGAGGKSKSIRRSVSMDDCCSLTTTRGVLFRLHSGRQHRRPLRSKSSSYCGGRLWKEELNENTN